MKMNKKFITAAVSSAVLLAACSAYAGVGVPTTAYTTLKIQDNSQGGAGVNIGGTTYDNVINSDLDPSISQINDPGHSNPWSGKATQETQGQDYDFTIPFSNSSGGSCTLHVHYYSKKQYLMAEISKESGHMHCDPVVKTQNNSANKVTLTIS